MRIIVATTACAATLAVGFVAGRNGPAAAVATTADKHAGHDMAAMTSMAGFQQSAAIPASATTAAERIAKSPRHAEWVAINVNATDSVMAWVVYPERKDKAPVVIAIHENTGINTWTRSVADQLAGFCWGGGRSFMHAVHAPGLGASVVYYGTPPTPDQLAAIRAPVLGLYGGNDARITSTVPATDSTMKQLGKSFEYAVFDGAGHGFLRGQDQSPANLAAAQAAWPKTVAFFRAKLGK